MVSKGLEQTIQLLFQIKKTDIEKRVKSSRKVLEEVAAWIKLPKDVKIEKVDIESLPGAWISTPNSKEERIILYLHGGGYMQGSFITHNVLISRICRASDAKALFLDYRLAPEHPFPAAIEDSIKAYKWLITTAKINPSNLIIAGDSAGGGLTLATLIKLRDLKIPLPRAAVCLSPWTNLTQTGGWFKDRRISDPVVTREELFFMVSIYIGDEDPENPLISPLYANLEGLPPILIHVGKNEILFDDSTRIYERAKQAGVKIELKIWEDMFHVFQIFAPVAPEGQEAIDEIGDYIKKQFN